MFKHSLFALFLAGCGSLAAASLPEVSRPPSQSIAPIHTFDLTRGIAGDRVWIESADGGKKLLKDAPRNGVLRLEAGEELVCDASLLPATGTVVVRIRVADADTGSGPVLKLPFGGLQVTMGKGAKRPLWLTGIPGGEAEDGRLKGRGDIPAGRWSILAVGYTPDKVQFHANRQLIGESSAKLSERGKELRIGDRKSKLPLEIRELSIFDLYFDFNDVLKALYRDPAAFAENAGELAEFSGKWGERPRVLATADTFREIRELAANDAGMQELLRRHARRYELTFAGGPRPEPFGELKREEGNGLAMLAILYRATGEERYLAKAIEYIGAIVDYRIWDGDKPYWTNNDLATGHLLIGLGIAYDYLHEELSETLKGQMREVVRFRAGDLAQRIMDKEWTWGTRLMNNHGCVTSTGLMTVAAGFGGDLPEAALWANIAHRYMKEFLDGQPPDGGDFEGVGYSQYSMAHAMIFADLARSCWGIDYYQNDWLKRVTDFRIQSGIPEQYWVRQQTAEGLQRLDFSLLSFGDTRQRDFFTPTAFAWKLGAEYRRGDYLAFAEKVCAIDNFCRDSEYLSLIYLHAARKSGVRPSVEPLPAFAHYPDVDKVLMRSGWSGDESVMIFRCGPPTGHRALHKFTREQGDGHIHPDVGAFSLFAAGELLIINSDYCYKLTTQENTLTVNGVGQLGDDQKWPDSTPYYQTKAEPAILHAESSAAVDYVIGDATQAYLPAAGLTRFHRHILFIKPDCWVIADDVAAKEKSAFELRFHSLLPGSASGKHGIFTGKNGQLQFRALQPREARLTFGQTDVRLIDNANKPRKTSVIVLDQPEKADSALFVTVLAAGQAGSRNFTAEIADEIITIVKDGRTHQVKLNRRAERKLEYLGTK